MVLKKKNLKPLVQRPFRCTNELNVSFNKARGALLLKSGEKISENSFLIMLFEYGLAAMNEKISKTEIV